MEATTMLSATSSRHAQTQMVVTSVQHVQVDTTAKTVAQNNRSSVLLASLLPGARLKRAQTVPTPCVLYVQMKPLARLQRIEAAPRVRVVQMEATILLVSVLVEIFLSRKASRVQLVSLRSMLLSACSALHMSLSGATARKGNFAETSLSVLLAGANWYAFRAAVAAAQTMACAKVP